MNKNTPGPPRNQLSRDIHHLLGSSNRLNIKNNPNHHPWNPQFESSIYMFLCVHLFIYLKKQGKNIQKRQHPPALYENVHFSKVTPFFLIPKSMVFTIDDCDSSSDDSIQSSGASLGQLLSWWSMVNCFP